MSQFTRSKLSRGVKLLLEHVYSPMQSVATALSSAGIQTQSVRESDTSFRVTFWVPQLSGYHLYANTSSAPWLETDGYSFAFPFAIPQPQELLSATAVINQNTVRYKLEEMSVSFDQRAEPAAIVDSNNIYPEGDLSHNATTKLDIKISLLEKTMLSYNAQAGYDPDREVFSATLSPTFYAGRFLRLNPFLFTELNKDVHPYKSLLFCVQADGLHPEALPTDANNLYLSLPSFMCSMRFSCDRVARDGSNTQNIPDHDGVIGTSPFTISVPLANDTITADNNPDGVSYVASLFDNRLMNKLLSGYTKQGGVSLYEHMQKDSGLEVIAVPLWTNFSQRGRLTSTTVTDAAHAGPHPHTQPIVDERWIPINYPFVIHHCLLGLNYGSPASAAAGPTNLPTIPGAKPSSGTFVGEVGVSLFTGQQADESAFQQIAYLSYTAANIADRTIDRLRHSQLSVMTGFDYTFDLVQIPIVGAGGVGLNNVSGVAIPQGHPVFVAKGASTLTAGTRSNVDGSAPATKGCEQYIVVRQSFEDPNGLESAGAPAHNNEVYAGVGGNWLYLIGKKTVVGGRDPKMTAGR